MALPHSVDAQWFITGGCSLGEQGTSAAMVAVLMYGFAGDPCNAEHTPSDSMLGLGEPPRREGEVARARRCWAVWRRLSPSSQAILLARYTSRQWPPGVAGQLGELSGVVVCIAGSSRARRRIADARERLAQCDGMKWTPAVAEIHASAQPGILECDWTCVVEACQGNSKDALKARGRWLVEAKEALSEAIDEWVSLSRGRESVELAA